MLYMSCRSPSDWDDKAAVLVCVNESSISYLAEGIGMFVI